MERRPEEQNGNPLEIALDNLPEDQRKAFEALGKSYAGLRELLSEALDPGYTSEHAMQSLDRINAQEWNKGHQGVVDSGMIMFENEDHTRQFQLKWSKKGKFVKPSISISYSVADIR